MPLFPEEIRKIKNGQPVDEEYTNKPLSDIEKQILYLKWRLDQIGSTHKWILYNAPIHSGVEFGHVVYFNTEISKFDNAIVRYKYDETGYVKPDESCIVEGLVIEKVNDTQAHIFLGGYLTDFDFSNTIIGSLEPGIYYLSQTHPGKLTKDISDIIGIAVLKLHSSTSGMLLPTYRNLLEDHIHVKLNLEITPAGDAPAPALGERHYIINPNSNLKGWLPANHPIFEGKAPEGAKFGYNINADEYLSKNFPILPLTNIYVELNGFGLDEFYCKIDENGIWWMTNCYGLVPWNPRANYQQGIITGYYNPYHSSWSSSSLVAEWYDDPVIEEDCPPPPMQYLPGHFPSIYEEHRFMQLWFTKFVFKTDRLVVTELISRSPLIQITGDSGRESSTGRLYLNFGGILNEEHNVEGTEVVKHYDGQKLYKGLAVEGIKSGTGGILIEGTDIGDGYKSGRLKISVANQNILALKNTLDIISVNDVGVDIYKDILYYSFPYYSNEQYQSSILGKVYIPYFGDDNEITFNLYLMIFVLSAGTIPKLQYQYKRISWGESNIPDSFTQLEDIDLSEITEPNKIYYIKAPSFTIKWGDILFINIIRKGNDGYTDTINVIDFIYSIE